MKRLGFALISLLLLAPVLAAQDVKDEAVKNALLLQQAMEKANVHLTEGQSDRAVAVLEEQLGRVGGHRNFLALMRKAYRSYIVHLQREGEAEKAKRFLERLCVLEPEAGRDPALLPPPPEDRRVLEKPPPLEPEPKPPLPKFTKVTPAPAKKIDRGPDPSTVRAHGAEPGPSIDPFDEAFRRPDPARDSKRKLAQMFLSRAEDQFNKRRFAEAQALYEQAYEADSGALVPSKGRYAYCLLDRVVAELNRPGLTPEQLPVLKNQAVQALTLAPELGAKVKWLLPEIDSRLKGKAATFGGTVELTIQHLGKNKEGWNVAETPHFRIFHHQGTDFAEKVAQIAETTRLHMYRKWFGHDGIEWTPKCELILHPTGTEYHRMTGVPAESPGHARIESDPSGKRVVSRRLDLRLDHPGALEAVLPHETTHVVLAGMFEGNVVPRWADEGIAVLTEPEDRVVQHRRNLNHANSLGHLFKLKELMELNDYPEKRRIPAFYAQSVGVIDFLTRLKGPRTVTRFLTDGLRDGYEPALMRHYGMDFAALEGQWREYLTGGALAAK